MPDIFFLKKFVRCPCIDLTFFVKTVAASFVSVLAPIAKFGVNKNRSPPKRGRRHRDGK